MAESVAEKHEVVKKELVSASQRRKVLYGKDVLMPQAIFQNIPYKQTHEALKMDDYESLKTLLCSFVSKLASKIWQFQWDQLGDDKNEKRRILKALVYLDALITLYRMP